MLDRIDTNTVRSLFNLEIVVRDEQEEIERLERLERQRARKQAAAMSAFTGAYEGVAAAGEEAKRHTPFVRDQPKVKPNDPCYCGSGKKFKKCHGIGV
jgi:preprotein translocase subunit SecA